MKKLFILLSFLCIKQAKAQTYVLIPDANFATYLHSIVPGAMSGNSLNITSTLVTTSTQTIIIGGVSISNLSGIQYFTSLTYLDCSSISLSNLPALPNSLQALYCGQNSLTALPALPNSLQTIICYYNSLTILPALPNSLQTLSCDNNSLTTLPTLPNGLLLLSCSFNSLTALPALPNSLTYLDCNTNNVPCFPVFPNSINSSLNISPNPFNCLPNYLPIMTPSLLAIPLCAAGNTHGCPVSSVGIKELNANNNDISIYPNPANDFLYLSSDRIEFTKASIINSLGQLLTETELIYTDKKTTINLKDLPNGVYLLNLKGNNSQTVSQRFVVAR